VAVVRVARQGLRARRPVLVAHALSLALPSTRQVLRAATVVVPACALVHGLGGPALPLQVALVALAVLGAGLALVARRFGLQAPVLRPVARAARERVDARPFAVRPVTADHRG
jgi:hypothetical protein